MKRFAFTMLELVFVIIVIGILAVLAIPSFNSNPLQQAAEQVANHIRYTQHLAMVYDEFNASDTTWYLKKWQIRFRENSGKLYYAVYSDKDKDRNVNCNAITCDEPAIDPLTKKPLYYLDSRANKKMLLTENYGIKDINVSCDTPDSSLYTSSLGVISFDHLGRPYNGIGNATAKPFDFLMTSNCNITLAHKDGNATITVHPETGYVSVSYN
jgi:type II secretory pathway pseudopilin PulG